MDLKHDFANILLKSIFEAVPVDDVPFTVAESSQKYKIFGCLACLAEFGPVMAEKAIIPNFGAILETIMKQDRMDQIRNSEPQIEKLTMFTQYQEIFKAILQKQIEHIKINKRAENDGDAQIEKINNLIKAVDAESHGD